MGLTLSTCPQVKRQELLDLPAVPRGHLVISPEELQVTLDVIGRTVLSFFFFFTLFYNTVLVLPYINMNLPWVYMSSQS